MSTQALRVLVADDDAEMRALLTTSLRLDGYEVLEAKSGVELLDHVAPWLAGMGAPRAIDVVVSDILMPGFTGMEILEGLYEVGCGPSVVLITGFGDEDTHARARSLGALAVLDKPFDVDDLRTLLMNLRVPFRHQA